MSIIHIHGGLPTSLPPTCAMHAVVLELAPVLHHLLPLLLPLVPRSVHTGGGGGEAQVAGAALLAVPEVPLVHVA